ncbi:3-deoxy-7-phosphoheptulonate synthase [Streptomyces sp. NPDC020141]|uniref:3-deoxy-7-phosphoheptulonate synthase n=1 Tax=Streptomyces sp. NPDC020141 TaxID=3365065 RepID=UPI00378FD46D
MTADSSSASALMSPAPADPIPEQQPLWPDPEALARVVERLSALPRLTTETESGLLRAELAAAGRGEGLVLHGGDCAERFEDSDPATVLRKTAQLRALADRMRDGSGAPRATAVGRIAGQYAKPRSEEYEITPDGVRLHSYRGDAVNAHEPDPALRVPDPARLLTAHDRAARVLRTVRETWRGIPPGDRVFVSHELLLLPYERALLNGRVDPDGPAGPGGLPAPGGLPVPDGSAEPDGRHAGSTHFGWIGERTRRLDGAHVAFAASLSNPVGVKLGPGAEPAEAAALVRRLNPRAEEGRLTLVVRMGADRIGDRLPALARAVIATGVPVVWLCDPMHGNTLRAPGGTKTRAVPSVRAEVTGFVRVLRSLGAHPAGLSLELTPDPVTECVDARSASAGPDLFPDYRSLCDPRLNPAQANAVVGSFLAAL